MEKNTKTVTKEMLIKKITKECGRKFENIRECGLDERLHGGEELNIVKSIYNILENNIAKELASVDEDNDVVVKLFEGITLNGSFAPAQRKLNNLTGKKIRVPKKIKLKANITRNYKEKLMSYDNH